MKSAISILLVLSLSISQVALACLGGDENFDISFSQGEGEQLIIHFKTAPPDKSKPRLGFAPAPRNEEFLDDDGFLSATLIYVYLIKKAEKESVKRIDVGSDHMQMFKDQLNRFRNHLVEQGSLGAAAVDALDDLLALYRNGPASTVELSKRFTHFRGQLYQNGLSPAYQTRKVGQSNWSKLTRINDMNLPSEVGARGCNSGISSMGSKINPDTNEVPKKKVLPALQIR
ncbi:MAG: hypothetical protein IT289_10550 [Oligoflexia bacterium]|nr:hypothetical protein [Oligoflexia bacterium]